MNQFKLIALLLLISCGDSSSNRFTGFTEGRQTVSYGSIRSTAYLSKSSNPNFRTNVTYSTPWVEITGGFTIGNLFRTTSGVTLVDSLSDRIKFALTRKAITSSADDLIEAFEKIENQVDCNFEDREEALSRFLDYRGQPVNGSIAFPTAICVLKNPKTTFVQLTHQNEISIEELSPLFPGVKHE